MTPEPNGRFVTRREALAGGAALAAARLVPGSAVAAARPADAAGITDIRIPIPAPAFRRPGAGRGPVVTGVLRSPRPLTALGLTWDAPQSPRIDVRVRQAGRWSRWVPLRPSSDHGPDRASERRISDLALMCGARAIQVRSDRIPAGLVGLGVAVSPTSARAQATALQLPGAPPITARAAWGAQAPRASPAYGAVELAFVHHTVSVNDYEPSESGAIVRAIQHYHRNQLGWNDIGYNLLVDRYGQLFEGRAGGVDQAVIGAQAQGYNSVSTGIAVIGAHTSEPLAPESFDALAALVAWKLRLHGVPASGQVTVTSTGGSANRYPAGRQVTLERISGHRDGDSTACPGEALYAQLPALRAKASELIGASGFSLSVTPERIDQGEAALASGRLMLPDASPGAGLAVAIEARTSRGWQRVAETVADAEGRFTSAIALSYTRVLRAVAVDVSGGVHRSSRARLEVRSAVHVSARPHRSRYGRRVLVRGTVEPQRPRQRVIVTVARRARSGRYRRVVRFAAHTRDGRLTVPLHPSRPGLYRVRVSAPADRLNAPGRSAHVFIRAVR